MQRIISLPRVSAHGTTSLRSAPSIRRTVINNNQSFNTVAMLLAGRAHRPFLRRSLGMPPTASSAAPPAVHACTTTLQLATGVEEFH